MNNIEKLENLMQRQAQVIDRQKQINHMVDEVGKMMSQLEDCFNMPFEDTKKRGLDRVADLPSCMPMMRSTKDTNGR